VTPRLKKYRHQVICSGEITFVTQRLTGIVFVRLEHGRDVARAPAQWMFGDFYFT